MKVLRLLLVLGVTVGVVEGLLWILQTPSYIFPRPTDVAVYLSQHVSDLARDVAITGLEAAVGLIIAMLVSVVAIAVCHFLRGSATSLSSMIVAAQSIPILALAPFLTLWFGPYFGSKIAAAFITCVFPMMAGWVSAYQSVGLHEHRYAMLLFPSPLTSFLRFVVRRASPGFFGALKVSCPLAVLGAIVGEFVGASSGLGFRILRASYYLRTEEMFASLLLACLLSLTLFAVARSAERRLVPWSGKW